MLHWTDISGYKLSWQLCVSLCWPAGVTMPCSLQGILVNRRVCVCVNVCLQAQAKSLIPTEISRMCSMQISRIAAATQWRRNAWCVPAQTAVASLTAGEVSGFLREDRKVKSDPSASLPYVTLTSELAVSYSHGVSLSLAQLRACKIYLYVLLCDCKCF